MNEQRIKDRYLKAIQKRHLNGRFIFFNRIYYQSVALI